MSSPTYYNTGTASVANGATAIAFEGALLGTAEAPNFIAGDLFCDPAQPLVPPQRIASVDYDAGTAALAVGWPGTSLTDDPYEVRYVGDTVRSTAQTRRLLEQLSVVQANGRGLFYRFSTLIGDVELDPGYLALNNADPAAATGGALSNTDANGATVSAEIDTWDDADATTRGKLWVRSVSRPAVFRSYAVTGTVVTATGRRKLTFTHVGGGGSFAQDEELMAFFVPNGNKGASFQYDVAVANAAARAAYDGAAEGFVVLELDNGATPSRTVFWRMGAGGSGDWELVAYLTGEAGVTPRGAWLTATVYALNDLATFGGNAYVCAVAHTSGDFATDLAASKWGLFVAQGAKGWSPQLVAEADGARRVMKLAGYVGGAGTAPTNNVGEYLKADGTYTANIAEAADFRGAVGAPGLDGASQYIRVHGLDTTDSDPATSGYENGLTLGGRTAATGERYLRASAGHPERNGIWPIVASGGATRDAAFTTYDSMPGIAVRVIEGTGAATTFNCISEQGGVLGTDPIVFEAAAGALSDGDYGDIVVSGGGAAMTVEAAVLAPERLPTLANSAGDLTNDIDIGAGAAWLSTASVPYAIRVSLPSLTKRLDAGWAAGTNQGFRNSGVGIADGTYHIYAVAKAAGADPEYYAHTSTSIATVLTALQAETGGSAYIYARRIFSIVRVSGAIRAFRHYGGDEVKWDVVINNVSAAAMDTSGASVGVTVPAGIAVDALLAFTLQYNGATLYGLWSALDQTNSTPGSGIFDIFVTSLGQYASIYKAVRTNTSGQIRQRGNTASGFYYIMTHGYIDRRLP